MNQFTEFGQESETSSVVGHSNIEVSAWVVTKSNNLGSSNWTSTLSWVNIGTDGPILGQVPEEGSTPSLHTTFTHTSGLEHGFSALALVGNEGVSSVGELGTESESCEDGDGPVVVVEGPVLTDVGTLLAEIDGGNVGDWEQLAVEVTDNTEGSLGLSGQVTVRSWEVELDEWGQGVDSNLLAKS